ncbi:MAG: hypothetical protein R3C32_10705 [Chloroflexota bacterium]
MPWSRLTDVEGNVEIEVWPKAGQSAYVVVPPPVARAIADQVVRMADAAEGRPRRIGRRRVRPVGRRRV